MFILDWIGTIPVEGPLRAFIMVGITLTYAAVLFGLGEIILLIANRFRKIEE